MKKYLLLLWVASFWVLNSNAQQITARPMPFLDQLPSQEITTLYQDKKGFIWAGTTHGLGRFDGYDLQIFRSDYLTPGRLSDNHITGLAESEASIYIGTKNGLNVLHKESFRIELFSDPQLAGQEIKSLFTDRSGYLWISTKTNLYRCDTRSSTLKTYPLLHSIECGVVSMFQDKQGTIWALTWGDGLFKYQRDEDRFVSMPKIGKKNAPFVMYQDKQARYWIGTWGDGLFQFMPESEPEGMYVRKDIASSKGNTDADIYFGITQDNSKGHLWALTYHELYAFDITAEGKLEKVDIAPLINTKRMYSHILKDREGSLWISAYDTGYNVFFGNTQVQNYPLLPITRQTGLATNLNCMNEDQDGILWFNQERGGLTFYNARSGELGVSNGAAVSGMEIDRLAPSRNKNQMWVSSSFMPWVFNAVRQGMSLHFKDTLALDAHHTNPGLVTELLEDRSGNLWIGTTHCLFLRPAHTTKLLTVPGIHTGIAGLAEDEEGEGKVWLGSAEKGLCQIQFKDSLRITAQYATTGFLTETDKISILCTDQSNKIWIGTSLGAVFLFDPLQKTFQDKTVACGANGDRILNLLSKNEDLWIVTPNTLLLHHLTKGKNTYYTTSDEHITVSSFRNRAAFIGHHGTLYAGGHNGFVSIGKEAAVQKAAYEKRIEITDVRLDNKSFFFDASGDPAREATPSRIVLRPEDKNLEIRFSALTYSPAKKTKYAYKLDGVDEDWIVIEKGKHTAFYNRLSQGEYQFHVRSTNELGEWSNETTVLHLARQAAWFETEYAYLLYAVLLFGAAGLFLGHYSRRIKKKNAVRFQGELTQAKLDYFTNVSHELLTPLTVLSCLTEELETEKTASQKIVSSMHNNVVRLKKLIQQVLDFRKMEESGLALQVEYGHISEFLNRISQSDFAALTQKRNIHFVFESEPEEIYGYFDADKLDRMLYNLLSNAVKYTAEGKKVGLKAHIDTQSTARMLHITVWDEGIGIEPQELDRIFTRFYRNKKQKGSESNGIGLSLTRALVQLHHGSIHVESEPGAGSRFIVSIPIDRHSYTEEECMHLSGSNAPNPTPDAMPLPALSGDAPLVLVIDDNPELLELISKILSRNYAVAKAPNSTRALEILAHETVHLVLCDVMMPGTDGLVFCRMLKQNLTTSHIPVLMLTAKNTTETRIECYNAGADGYVSKPFETKVLLARIDNLLHTHTQRQQKFRLEKEINVAELEYQFADERFLNDIVTYVEQKLGESDFDLEQLATGLNVSKSTMNRKIKAMTGLTPMDFVKNIKMKYACKMLLDTQMTISEIAYAVGFNNPKYFTRCFKEEFGTTPTQYQQAAQPREDE